MNKVEKLKKAYEAAKAAATEANTAWTAARTAVRDAWREYEIEYEEQRCDNPWCDDPWWKTKFTKEEQEHLERNVSMYPNILDKKTGKKLFVISKIIGPVNLIRGDVGTIKGDVGTIKGNVKKVKGNVEKVKGNIQKIDGNIDSNTDVLISNFNGYINGYEWDYEFNPRYHTNSELISFMRLRFNVTFDGRTKRATLLEELNKLRKSGKKKGEMCDSHRHYY